MFLVPVNSVDMIVVFPLAMIIHFFWDSLMVNPEFQAVVNTTLVVLQNTEVVWRPVLTVSLVLAKPILELALLLLKPILHALILIAPTINNLALQGMNLTSHLLLTMREVGLDIRSSLSHAFQSIHSFSGAIFTITKAFSNVLYYSVKSMSYILSSFESVGDFAYRLVFETRTVTWNDVYAISTPFVVVASILGYITWSSYTNSYRYRSPEKETCEYAVYPRRSSRIARKRALMLLHDLPPQFSCSELSASVSASSPNL